MILTESEIAEMKKRADAATPGPWEDHNWDLMERPHVVAHSLWNGKDHCNGHFDVPCVSDNTSFIAHSRIDIPALIESHEELRSQLMFKPNPVVHHDECQAKLEIAVEALEKYCVLPLPLDEMPNLTIGEALKIFAERTVEARDALKAIRGET